MSALLDRHQLVMDYSDYLKNKTKFFNTVVAFKAFIFASLNFPFGLISKRLDQRKKLIETIKAHSEW